LHQVISCAVDRAGIALLREGHVLSGKERDFQQQLPGRRRRCAALKEASITW
jgi:hypothetical protein